MHALTAVALCSIAFVTAGPVHAAELHKCTTAAGNVEYRDYPCDAATRAQTVQLPDNTFGTGRDLADIRAQNAAFDARQAARAKADAEAAEALWRARAEARAHQDSVDLASAIRESYARPTDGYYYGPYAYRPDRLPKTRDARPSRPPPSIAFPPKRVPSAVR